MGATLLSFVGLKDPFHYESSDDGRIKGPLLTILDERRFQRVILFGRPHRQDNLTRTLQAVRELHPQVAVESRELAIADSTSHSDILTALRPALAKIRRAHPDDDYWVSLLSATPESHACWVLLVASGELSARLLNFRRTVHNHLAGPRLLRELDWSAAMPAVTPETLALLTPRRDRWDDPEQQASAANVPRHYFVRHSIEQAVQLSRHATPLLIHGEPGTQKQLMAGLVHQFGNRAGGPLVIVNCATVPLALFEVALFGEENDERGGKVREADGGTLVLIKVQHVPAPVLLRLFKAVDDGYYYRAKRSVPIRANVRLIGTTDRDLETEVQLDRFPAEIWRRLQASMVRLPPLRQRPRDITILARDELERLNRTLPRPKRFSASALAKLESHPWPSNIAELRRAVEHAVISAEAPVIESEHIDLDLSVNLANVFGHAVPRIREGFSLENYLRTLKYELVRSALRKTRGNQTQAAALLGITPQAVSKLRQQMEP